MTKGWIHQEDMSKVNLSTPTIEAPTHIKQLLRDLKGQIDCNYNSRDFNQYPTSHNNQIIQTESQ